MSLKLSDQPVAYSALAKAVVALLVLLGLVSWSAEQVAGVLVTVDAVLGIIVFQSVKPVAKAEAEKAAAVDAATDAGRNAAIADVASLAQVFPATLEVAKKAPARQRAPRKAAAK